MVAEVIKPFITFEPGVLIFNFIVVGAAVGHDMRQAGTQKVNYCRPEGGPIPAVHEGENNC